MPILPALLLAGASSPAPDRGEDPAAIERRLADVAQHLSSDEMEGRGLGTKGIDLAAAYLADRFRQLGLKTDLWEGGPFQKFRVAIDAELGPSNRLTLVGPTPPGGGEPETIELAAGAEFTPLAISGSCTFDLPLVFAGYGISAPAFHYDDYASVDVTGKAVIVLRHQPRETASDKASAGFKDVAQTLFRHKASNAYEHGASLVIFCTDYAEIRKRRGQDDTMLPLHAAGTTRMHQDLPVLHCRRAPIDRILRATAGTTLAKLEEEIDRGMTPRSRELEGWRVRGKIDIRHVNCEVKNVVGVLPGDGPPADETVVVGAHYDHFGYGSRSSLPSKRGEMYPGADDNASGLAVLLEVARTMVQRAAKPRRQLVFVAFTGEEWGFFGSSYYVNHPVGLLDKTVAMINLDMIGRLQDDKLTVNCVATGTTLNELVDRASQSCGLKLNKVSGASGRSDQAAFYAKKIPNLHFFTGRHADYHRTGDTFAKLNIAGMRRIAGLVENVTAELAELPARPQYQAVAMQRRAGETPPPFFGSIPDFTREEPGYPISGVIPGSPAERCGLQGGDVIVHFAKSRIGTIDDFEDALRKHAGGERVRVKVRRQAASMTFETTLGPPR